MHQSAQRPEMVDEPVLARARVLILTDDIDASRAWTYVLGRYDIEAMVSAYDGLAAVSSKLNTFHEILVDHYDEPSGALQLCRRLRSLSSRPLLLFTYESDERFHLDAYRLGVEECVAKPIGIPLFVAKTRAWLRQVAPHEDPMRTVTVHGLRLNPESRVLECDNASIKLSNLECRLLFVLMANRGQVVETEALTKRVWSMYGEPDRKMLKNLVYRLRHKIARIAGGRDYIENVEGYGYIFHNE